MQVRCQDCQKEHHKKRMREKYRNKEKAVKPDPHDCKRKQSCIYGGKAGTVPICDYLDKTGKFRPCPVQGCTEYKKKPRKKGESNEQQDNR